MLLTFKLDSFSSDWKNINELPMISLGCLLR